MDAARIANRKTGRIASNPVHALTRSRFSIRQLALATNVELLQPLEPRMLLAAATATFDYSGSFPSGQMTLNNGASIVSNDLVLTTANGTAQARSAFRTTKVNVGKFATRFVYHADSIGSAGAGGFAFELQNQAATTFASVDGNGGNGGYTSSGGKVVALRMQLAKNGELALLPTSRKEPIKPEMYQIQNGHSYEFVLTYDGATLYTTVTDLSTNDTMYRHYAVNIPGLVGANTAWAGFTASSGTGSSKESDQTITEWVYYGEVHELPPLPQLTADGLSPYQAPAGNIIRADGPYTVIFNAGTSLDPDGTISGYLWDFGDGTTPSTSASPTHTYSTADEYTVSLIVTDNQGNDSAVSQKLRIEVDNALDAVIEVEAPSSMVGPVSVQFDATKTVGLSEADLLNARFRWNFDTNEADPNGRFETGEGMVATHVFEKPGTYTVTLTVTDAAGISDSATTTVTVDDIATAGWTTYYVSDDHGNATYSGTIDFPKTLNSALSLLGPNVRLLLRQGETFERNSQINLSQPGPIIIDTYEDTNPVHPSSGLPILYGNFSGTNTIVKLSGSQIRLMNLSIQSNGGSSSDPGGVEVTGDYNLISNLYVEKLGNKVFFCTGQYNTFIGCSSFQGTGTNRSVGPYFLYGSGARGIGIIGNDVVVDHPTVHEHVVRFQGGYQGYIAHNSFGASRTKSNVQIRGQSGMMVIYDNTLIGRDSGANPQNKENEEYVHHVVWDSNKFQYNQAYAYIGDAFPIASNAIVVQGRHVVIRNNTTTNYRMLTDLQSDAITGPSREVFVYNNTIFANSTQKFWNKDTSQYEFSGYMAQLAKVAENTKHVEIKNNLVYSSAGSIPGGFAAINVVNSSIGSDLVEDHNFFYATNWNLSTNVYKWGGIAQSLTTWQGHHGTGDAVSNTVANALLQSATPGDPNFLKLQSGSPAVNAGASVPVFVDLEGQPRPQGSAYDIGAFEAPGASPAPPTAPSGLSATAVNATQINLSWTDNSSTETGFIIERKTGSGTFVTLHTTAAGVVSFTDTTVQAATPYTYRVKATNSAGPSATTNQATATTPGTGTGTVIKVNFELQSTTTPSGYLRDSGDSFANRGNGYSYGWNTNHMSQDRERGVHADKRLDTLVQFLQGGKWEISLPNGTYDVYVSIGDPSFSSTYTLRAEGQSYWNGLSLGANSFANQSQSITVSDGRLTIDQNTAGHNATRINYIEITDTQTSAAPSAPINPNATVAIGAVTVRWSDTSSNETGFRVERSANGTSGWTQVGSTTGVNAASLVDSTASADTTYYYRVFAVNGATDSTSPTSVLKARTPNWTATTNVAPSDDTYVRDGQASTNFGTSSIIEIKNGAAGTTRYGYFKFDISSFTTTSTAKLRLYGGYASNPGAGVTADVQVFDVTDTTWTEGGINWNNKPATNGSALATTTITATTGWYEWDISSHIQAARLASKTTIALRLHAPNAMGSSPQLQFNSTEAASNQPQLQRGQMGGTLTLTGGGVSADDYVVDANSTLTTSIAGSLVTYDYASITSVVVNGSSSDDKLTAYVPSSVGFTFNGGAGNDEMIVDGDMTFASDLSSTTSSLALAINDDALVTFGASQHLRSLTLRDGAAAVMTQNGSRVLVTDTVAVGVGARLDLKDNDMIVRSGTIGTWDGDAYTDVTGLVDAGRGSGTFSGSGIVTSMTGATSGSGLTTLGVATAGEIFGITGGQTALFAGQTVTAGSILIKYTYGGDANFSGYVDADDYWIIDGNADDSGLVFGFNKGDFNYDGLISGDDYAVIDYAFGAQGSPL